MRELKYCNFKTVGNKCLLKHTTMDNTEHNFDLCDGEKECVIFLTYKKKYRRSE